MKRFIMRVLLTFSAAVLLSACGSSSSSDGGGGGGGSDTTAPQVLSAPGYLPLGSNQDIVIVFDESMDTSIFTLGGTLAGGNGGLWSNTTITDDTLTISPTVMWSLGDGQTLTVDAQDPTGNPLTTMNLNFNVHTGTLYFVSSGAINNDGDGQSPAMAKQTIQAAIDAATAPASVIVNAGTYNVDSGAGTQVVIRDGVSLYGGYNSDFTLRNATTSVTDTSIAITGSHITPNRAIEASYGVTASTIINGFIITGGGGDYSAAIYSRSNITIENNVIRGGNASLNTTGITHITNVRSPTISGNTIHGGNSDRTYAIYNQASPSSKIIGNNIYGGDGTTFSYGIYNRLLQPPVIAGDGTVIRNNIISGGNSTSFSYAITNSYSLTPIYIVNNTINGGVGNSSSGINDINSSGTIVRNNTINGGSSNYTRGIEISGSSTPTIENNIIFTTSANISYCISERAADGDPAVLRNNSLSSCTNVYVDYDAACGDGDGDGDPTTCTFAEMQLLLDIPSLGDNVQVGPDFIDADGADNDPDTMDDNDWHLAGTTPASISDGGINGSTESSAWSFTDDKDGVARGDTGNWSMGAYEP